MESARPARSARLPAKPLAAVAAAAAVLLLTTASLAAQIPADCGYASAKGQAFIHNGENSSAAEFPWHAGLYIKSKGLKQVCGGSLVHPRIVLTAAHCLFEDAQYGKPWRVDDLKVTVGSSLREWTAPSKEAQQRNVSRVFPHPRYRGRARFYADDIGIVELETPIDINAFVVPVCVDWKDKNVPTLTKDDVGKVSGWGITNGGQPSPLLLSAELPYIPFDKCADSVPSDFLPFLTNDKFCAGHINGATVAPGDSGGGLAFKYDGLWYVQGVVSVGVPAKLSYTAFTKVSSFTDWISDIVSNVLQAEILPAAGVRWEPVSRLGGSGVLPADAVKGGYQRIGDGDNPHYVGRLWRGNAILPATVTKYGAWTAYAPAGNTPASSDTFEVAVADEKRLRWVPGAKGSVPEGAVHAGISADGDTLYACRAFDADRHKGNHYLMLTPGVLRPSTGVCSVEFHGVNNYTTYEVLVIAKPQQACKLELADRNNIHWEPISRRGGALPEGAVQAGYQSHGDVNNPRDNPHYVGRVWVGNAIIPATVTKYGPHWEAFAESGGKSVPAKNTFELAVLDKDRLRWVPATNGAVPESAVKGGITEQGETLYVCRVFDGERHVNDHYLKLTPGVLRPSSGGCAVEFHGVHRYTTYEVLVTVPSITRC